MKSLPAQDFRALFEAAPGLYLVVLPDFTIAAVSDAYLKASMMERTKIVGRKLFDMFPENLDEADTDVASNLKASLNYVLEYGKPHTMALKKYAIRNPNGTFGEKFLRALNVPVFNKKKELIYIIHNIKELTTVHHSDSDIDNINENLLDQNKEKEKQEAELAETRERVSFLASIASNIQDPIIASDNNYCTSSWNDAAEKLFEWKREEVIGKPTREVLNIIYPNNSREQILQSFLEKGHWQGEVIYHTKSGKPLNILATASQIKDGNGNATGILVVAKDITERKIAEEKIKESEHVFSTLFYESPNMKAIYEASTGKYVDINHAFAQFLERPKEEIVGKTSVELNMITNMEQRERSLKNLREFGKVKDLEMHIIASDGKKRWVSINAAKMNITANDYYLAEAIDITERKEAVEALALLNAGLEQKVQQRIAEIQKSENRFRALVENNEGIISLIDEKLKVLYRSSSAARVTGWTNEEFEVIDAKDYIHPDDAAQIQEIVISSFKNPGKALPVQTRVMHKNGYYMWLEGVITNMVHDATVGGIITNLRDITKRKEAEDALKEKNNFIESIIHSSPDIIYIYDIEEAKNIYVNKGIQTNLGYTDEEIKLMGNQLLIRLMHPDDFAIYHSETYPSYKKLMDKEIIGHEYRLKDKKGNWRWFFSKESIFLRNSDGTPKQIFGITSDITDRKQNEEDIKNTTEQLRELTAHLLNVREEERKRIGREIHDELGQQLTAIKMDVAWIDKKIPALSAGANETSILKSKLNNMIELLDGSNLSIRRILNELRPVILDDNNLLEALHWIGGQFTSNTGIPIRLVCSEAEIKLTEPLATCIFRVYQEALTNITRYAHAKNVNSSLTLVNNHILITIADNGKGFEPGNINNKKTFGILGMKERVLSLNGTFNIFSSPGKGTTINIRLPFVQ